MLGGVHRLPLAGVDQPRFHVVSATHIFYFSSIEDFKLSIREGWCGEGESHSVRAFHASSTLMTSEDPEEHR